MTQLDQALPAKARRTGRDRAHGPKFGLIKEVIGRDVAPADMAQTYADYFPGFIKKGVDNEQYVKAFHWDGHELKPAFELDFLSLGLGRAHHMKFTARASRHERDDHALAARPARAAR